MLAFIGAIAACSGSSSHSSTSDAGGGGDAGTATIRVANVYELMGQAGGPIDLYDVRLPGPSDVPLIKNLAYGQISDYVSPRFDFSGYSMLWLFPAGSTQPSGAYGPPGTPQV